MKKLMLIGALAVSAMIYGAGEVATPQAGMGMMNSNMQGQMPKGMMMNPNMNEQMPMMQNGQCPMMAGGMKNGMMSQGMMKGGMMPMMQNMTPEERAAMEKDMISMEEKKLEARKEMLKEKPDWKKIEGINKQVAEMRAKHMTLMMKKMHEGATK